jgi:hypothetical protein
LFKKLFGRKRVPTDVDTTSEGFSPRMGKKFSLELSNMEDTPSYELHHQLTVGSEIGNIVVADESVSPRHCTFVLDDGVVTVMDHGSVKGTSVNGKKISPGKSIILEETDSILVGDLEIKIHVQNVFLGNTEEAEEEAEEEVEEETAEETEEEQSLPVAPTPEVKKEKKKVASKFLSFSSPPTHSTNAFVRVFAVLGDFLIAYTLLIVFLPFVEFQEFVADVPFLLSDLFDIKWSDLWLLISEEQSEIALMIEDLYGFLAGNFPVFPALLLFFLVRFISTVIFGVSLSELFLGVRSHGNLLWKRVGGGIRVILGMITGPLIIFDIPAVISRRTLKEFLTITQTYITSIFYTILGLLLYMPVLVVAALFVPLFQGLDVPVPLMVNDTLERRVKVKDEAPVTAEVLKLKERSAQLGFELEYDPAELTLVPQLNSKGQGKKSGFSPSISFYHRDLKRNVQLEVLKKFDLRGLLAIGFRGNFPLYERYPDIYEFVYSEGDPKFFKRKNDEKSKMAFATQVVSFTKNAFGLTLDNALDFMQTETFLLKGVMDYSSSFLQVLDSKVPDKISFIKIGNSYFLKMAYLQAKPYDLILPLTPSEGRILKVQFDSREQLSALSNKFYKFIMEGSNWYLDDNKTASETLSPMEVMDLFSTTLFKFEKIKADKAQALYGYYFEKSLEVLKNDDELEYELWKNSVNDIFLALDKLKAAMPPVETQVEEGTSNEVTEVTEVPQTEIAPWLKLHQNFQELKSALENRDKAYFGVEEVKSL